MRRQEIEIWALRVLERLGRATTDEDQHVEFKRQWSGLKSRQLAGAANAARGEPILWLIGIDPETHEVIGAEMAEKANVWPAIIKTFDGSVVPDGHDVEIEWAGKRVCAIQFDTDRAPYVIREGEKREVPWRELTKTRSAYRNELLLLLGETTRVPTMDVLSVSIVVVTPPAYCRLAVEVYIVPKTKDLVVIPFHAAELCFRSLNRAWVDLTEFSIFHGGAPSSYVQRSGNDVVVSGPGAAIFAGHFSTLRSAAETDIFDPAEPLEIRGAADVVHASSRLRFSATLSPTARPASTAGLIGYWTP